MIMILTLSLARACVMSIVGAVYRFSFANNGADFTWSLLDVILVK